MSVLPLYNEPNNGLFESFATTSGVAITIGQQVCFGADDDTVTGTSDANLCIGVATESVASGDAGPTRRIQVRLNGSAIVPMIGNGTCTRGKLAVFTGTAGKVTDTGSTPDARTIAGRFLKSSSTDGEHVPVMI